MVSREEGMRMTHKPAKQKPTFLSPQTLLLGKLPGLLSLWKHDHDHNQMRGHTGKELVAVWASLERLVLPEPPSENFRPLAELIRDQREVFLEATLTTPFDGDSWRKEMAKIDAEWDLGWETAEELEWQTQMRFDSLDQAELLAWFAAKHGCSAPRVQAWVPSFREQCEAAETFLANRTDLFICLATDLAAVIACSRPGLETNEPDLWETLGKHRRIEEAREEVELAPTRQHLLANVPKRRQDSTSTSATGTPSSANLGSSLKPSGDRLIVSYIDPRNGEELLHIAAGMTTEMLHSKSVRKK
jgi:hypothetical protein